MLVSVYCKRNGEKLKSHPPCDMVCNGHSQLKDSCQNFPPRAGPRPGSAWGRGGASVIVQGMGAPAGEGHAPNDGAAVDEDSEAAVQEVGRVHAVGGHRGGEEPSGGPHPAGQKWVCSATINGPLGGGPHCGTTEGSVFAAGRGGGLGGGTGHGIPEDGDGFAAGRGRGLCGGRWARPRENGNGFPAGRGGGLGGGT
jgi:hypothetical protein